MKTLETGKPFADRRYFVQEGMRVRFNSVGIDLIACAGGLSCKEIVSWRETMTVSFFGDGSPDAIFALKTTAFSFDAPINFLKVGEIDREAWLAAPFNIVTMILLEKSGGIVRGLRAVGLNPDFSAAIQSAMRAQLAHDATEIDTSSTVLLNTVSTETLIARSMHKQAFRRG